MTDEHVRISFEPALREDLRRRLARTRWSDFVTSDWQYGIDETILRDVLTYWKDAYDFDAAEARLNAIPHMRAIVDGFGVSYLHVRSNAARAVPLLLINGWPSSFVEYRRLISVFQQPGNLGLAFDLVIPALPGFGFSDRPRPGHTIDAEDLFHGLMTDVLDYPRYLVSGTDIGAGVATRLAMKRPATILGIHISAVVDPPLSDRSQTLTEAERAYLAQSAQWSQEEGAYEHVHYTRPQTLAVALADSPAGLASWIVEKFYAWSDRAPNLFDTFPLEMLVDNLMMYWASETIGSSMRYYYDHAHFRPRLTIEDRVLVPTAICQWPKDLVTPPREWTERFYNVQQFTKQSRGGHFPAWEAPHAYADDLRQFVSRIDPP